MGILFRILCNQLNLFAYQGSRYQNMVILPALLMDRPCYASGISMTKIFPCCLYMFCWIPFLLNILVCILRFGTTGLCEIRAQNTAMFLLRYASFFPLAITSNTSSLQQVPKWLLENIAVQKVSTDIMCADGNQLPKAVSLALIKRKYQNRTGKHTFSRLDLTPVIKGCLLGGTQIIFKLKLLSSRT